MPGEGLEPTRIAPEDFKSSASASSATPARCYFTIPRALVQLRVITCTSRLTNGPVITFCYNSRMKLTVKFKSILKVLGMVVAVGACGFVLGVVAGFLLAVIMRNQFSGWGSLLGVIYGILLFYPAGVILGLIIFKIWHYKGSLWLGILGVCLGEFMTFGLDYLLRTRVSSGVLIPVFLVLAPLLGAVGYNSRSKGPQNN